MNTVQIFTLFFLRVTLGCLFFYAGITKVLDPSWSAEGYISSAKMFSEYYAYFLKANILPLVNIANSWGLTLIGVSLISGIWVRWSSLFGIVLMALYYFAILDFPHPNAHAYIVDEHIIYIAGLLLLGAFNAGKAWGLGSKLG